MIDLETAKNHLRVDGHDEDELIQLYLDAAFSTFETWTNRKLIVDGDPLPEPVGNALHASRSIDQGVLLLVGHWYANRESTVIGSIPAEMPMATRALWMPHRWANL